MIKFTTCSDILNIIIIIIITTIMIITTTTVIIITTITAIIIIIATIKITIIIIIIIIITATIITTGGCPRGVMVKAMDCGIVVGEFEFQVRYYVHFRANTLGKGMNPLILPAMG